MNKSTFFTGQPIFNQLLKLIPRPLVNTIARELKADRYCKSFRSYEHLVTMLYASLNQCCSLREVTTGLLAWEQRIGHLGIHRHPRRSTLADANKRRPAALFEQLYLKLLQRYSNHLPDSRSTKRSAHFYIYDSTTITLFQEILKGTGRPRLDGKRKGGIKVHTLLHSRTDSPCLVRFGHGNGNDASTLKHLRLTRGSVIVFDKGYRDYTTYNRFSEEGITWVTRHRGHSVYRILADKEVNTYQQNRGVLNDMVIQLGHQHHQTTLVQARMIVYSDPQTGKTFEFITNNQHLAAATIADYYRHRWQIELFFKRIKQNFPLQYFLGDNENAIKIQIWTVLIADLLLRLVKRSTRCPMSYSNIVSLVRIHLMTYMDIKKFLSAPEKSLLQQVRRYNWPADNQPTLFSG